MQTPFSFGGQQQQQPTNQLFGQPAQPQQQSLFSFQPAQTQQTAAPQFSFGQPAQQQQQQQQQQSTPFSFGQPAQPQQPAQNAFSLGQPSQPAATPFSFGQSQQQATPAPAPAFSFGQPTQQQQQQPATPFSFGGTPAQAQPLQQQQPAAAPPFSFGTPAQTQAQAPTTGGMFSSFGNTTQNTSGLGGGLQTGQSSSLLGGFAKPLTQPTTTFSGLGGVPSSANADTTFSSLGTIGTRSDHRAMKELPIPTELTTLLEELKAHMKTEKIKMAEVARASYKSVEQVSNGLEEARTLLTNVSNMIQRQIHICEAFRVQINQDLKDGEMAQLTRETPAALQSEHHLPVEYFYKMIKEFEEKMASYSREIKKAEAAVVSIGGSPGITAQDLCVALKSSKDTLVVLAAKVKGLHDKVNGEIETHKNLLRFVHGEGAKDVLAARKITAAQDWLPKPSAATDSSNSSMLFPNREKRVSDPTQMYMTYMAGSKTASVGGVLHAAHSTPIYARTNLIPTKSYEQSSYNTSGYGSPSFIQAPTSPIFNPHNATSPPPASGISLKRSKH